MIYLAIDIGASSGRHIAAWREGDQLQMKEIYRFPNLPKEEGGHLVWDLDNLSKQVVLGLAECKKQGIIPTSVGIDTWAVDYVLLDENDKPIMPMYCYRDSRGQQGADMVHKIIPFADLYAKCGIQFQPFNTIYHQIGRTSGKCRFPRKTDSRGTGSRRKSSGQSNSKRTG